jgi:hypothetical protein
MPLCVALERGIKKSVDPGEDGANRRPTPATPGATMTLLSRRRSSTAPIAPSDRSVSVMVADDRGPEAPRVSYPVRVYTASHAIAGTIHGIGRLLDLLNSGPVIGLADVNVWRFDDADATFVHWIELDPFEVELVMARNLPDAPWVRARRINKQRHRAQIAADPYRIEGLVHTFAGADPKALARHAGGVFFPVTEPVVRRRGRLVSDPRIDAVMLNRHLVREVTLIDPPGVLDTGGALLARRAELIA